MKGKVIEIGQKMLPSRYERQYKVSISKNLQNVYENGVQKPILDVFS
jgi:hypothetical protein